MTKQEKRKVDKSKKAYGFELIMDLHGCDVGKFTRSSIEEYMKAVCEAIDLRSGKARP